MTLEAGASVGSYEIVGPIGAGGMGEVFRARDSKLGRDVALMILPDQFAHDSERLVRFRREAQLLASLNHPNIAAIYASKRPGSRPLQSEHLFARSSSSWSKDQRWPMPFGPR